MKYTVIWLEKAQNSLSSLWFNSPDQNAIMAAVDALTLRLSTNPQNDGESREQLADRIAFEPPLQVIFRVYPQKQRVLIGQCARFGRLK